MFAKKNILVLGDFIADIYINGEIERISREAPVLVLQYKSEKIVAGGAGNVANNIQTLGGNVFTVGIIGNDKNGSNLKKILESNGANCLGLINDEDRFTISKTRIIAGGRATVNQQIVRLDRSNSESISNQLENKLKTALDQILPNIDAIVLSDYGLGTITDSIQKKVIKYSREQNIPSIVDSRYNIEKFVGVNIVKQNDDELSKFYGRKLISESMLNRAAKKLLKLLQADSVLITRGEIGMTLFEKNGDIHQIPVEDLSEVFDVSGAGDTSVAAMILGIASGYTSIVSARIANIAAGIAVRKLGTSTVSSVELESVLKGLNDDN